MTGDWSHEETDDPLYADRRNFYKVEKWSRDRRHKSRQGAAHLRADDPAPAAHSADDPPAHAGVGRMATGRNVALMP
jgi:hypothetical protein